MDVLDVLRQILGKEEFSFIVKLSLTFLVGLLIGSERESRGKSAGISTHILVIAGSMIFTFLSCKLDPLSPGRISAQVVSGIGFLGAGIILKRQEGQIVNLTTAASIWYSAALGMLIGAGWYASSLLATLFIVIVFKLPSRSAMFNQQKIDHKDIH